jgi:hypothetical protein
MISYITHNDIDKSKWDTAIALCFNKRQYAYSWYLDQVSPNWDALILDDYVAVMPVFPKIRFGISCIYTPLFCPQLGVFSTIETKAFCVDDFINSIPSKFLFIDLTLNSDNFISKNVNRCKLFTKFNQELSLSDDYENIRRKFKKSHIKNVEKFESQNEITITYNNSFQDFYKFKIDSLPELNIKLKKQEQLQFFNLLKTTNDKELLTIYIGYDKNNCPQGGVCFMTIEERVFIYTFCNKLGKKYGLIYSIINQFITEHAGQNLILDFMGSSIDGVRYRNLGFGSNELEYSYVRINKLTNCLMMGKS